MDFKELRLEDIRRNLIEARMWLGVELGRLRDA